MLRWCLLLLACLLCALASLTVWKAPNLLTWKMAIAAGEYGHILCLGPLAIGVMCFLPMFGPSLAMRIGTGALCAAAFILFLGPIVQADRIGKALPAQLLQGFGPAEVKSVAFSSGRLFASSGKAILPETRIFARAGGPDELALDFYRATPAQAGVDGRARPCVVVVHGGGWDSGDRTQLPALNSELARLGYPVATIDYRLAPKSVWPAQRDDVLAAIAYLKSHASELAIDPACFVLLGRSAGGQIAEAVAYGSDDPAIRGVIAMYAPADMNFAWKYGKPDDVLDTFTLLRQYLGGAPEDFRQNYDEASAYLHVRPTTPPTLLIHGGLDTLVWHRQSERLAGRLAENKVPYVFLDLPWATHALDFNLAGPGGQLSTYAIEWFLATVAAKRSP